jgi:hypothetical protein
MNKEKLIGAWKLVSAQYSSADGKVNEIYGANPVGLLMYNPNGQMTIQIFRSDRPNFAKNDRLGGTPAEIQMAFNGMMAYFGTFSVDEEKQTVTHHLVGAWLPNWVGSDQTRRFELTQDRLLLRTPPLTIDGVQMNGQLVWERVG